MRRISRPGGRASAKGGVAVPSAGRTCARGGGSVASAELARGRAGRPRAAAALPRVGQGRHFCPVCRAHWSAELQSAGLAESTDSVNSTKTTRLSKHLSAKSSTRPLQHKAFHHARRVGRVRILTESVHWVRTIAYINSCGALELQSAASRPADLARPLSPGFVGQAGTQSTGAGVEASPPVRPTWNASRLGSSLGLAQAARPATWPSTKMALY